MKTLTEPELLHKAAAYCSLTERCPADVREKLQAWGVPSEAAAERILRYLERERYLDEERYCRAFIREKYRFAKWGRQKIAQALKLKQLPSALSLRCLAEEIDEEEYLDTLRSLLEAKARHIRARNDYELKGKLVRFALSRGFEMRDVLACMELDSEY